MNPHVIAILGGTGHEGSGLGLRWAKAGHSIIIGSRAAQKAQAAAAELNGKLGRDAVRGLDNAAAAQAAEILVLTVPYGAHAATIESVKDAAQGKIFVDVTVPLVPPRVSRVQMPAAGSASQEAQNLLGPAVKVVTAFQNIGAEHLKDAGQPIDCDVLVTGTSKQARQEVLKLVEAAGLIGWDAGPIENSVVVEGLTSVLININKQYGSTHAGIRITGVQNM